MREMKRSVGLCHAALLVALLSLFLDSRRTTVDGFTPSLHTQQQGSVHQQIRTRLQQTFYNDFGSDDQGDEDEDEDDTIDPDQLGDWRLFRKNLAAAAASIQDENTTATTTTTSVESSQMPKTVSKLNEQVLRSQSPTLYEEYVGGVWAHTTSVPEVGGLVVRTPLEAELFRNHKHSINGANLRRQFHKGMTDDTLPEVWFHKAQRFLEREIQAIADVAGEKGHIDATTLNDQRNEILSLYLDHQESWQETCLVLERDEGAGTATTLVLNRPMGFQLTDSLARMCLYGAEDEDPPTKLKTGGRMDEPHADLIKFKVAFGQECAVYIGGPDDQEKGAEIVHGVANLPGAVEISPGTRIYRGGLDAAVEGVLKGMYKPLDFRFFIGKHTYEESMLDVSVLLGKYQPVACSRSLVLKQCISLPKPLWHEIAELCGGEMKELSRLELSKKNGIQFEIVDEDDEDDDDDDDNDDENGVIIDGMYFDGLGNAFEELLIDDDEEEDEF